MISHEIYIQRCLELAQNGLGNVAPNPMVGCVIVHDDKIIGEGFHREFGKAHAEVNAIDNVQDKDLLKNCTLYVNLEPCSHYGKTPPCADLIIQHQIPCVVIGCQDTFSKVNGAGIAKLKAAGINLESGILEKECRKLNKRFFAFHEKQRPYIILKWAQSADGIIGKLEERVQISNHVSQKLVHKWRSEEAAIMVGTNTALTDNPQLNVRYWQGKNPVRVLLDKSLRLPQHLNLFDNSVKTIVYNSTKTEIKENTFFEKIDFTQTFFPQLFYNLYQHQIQSVLVEGGNQLLQHLINENLWDEARIFTSSTILGVGVKAPSIQGQKQHESEIGSDRLLILENKLTRNNSF